MSIQEFLKLFRRRKQTVLSVIIVCLAVAVLLVVFQPLKYGSSSRMLVSQEFSANTDAYTISQSNNYLSRLLAKVVNSENFYQGVVNSGYNINKDYFTEGNTNQEKMEEWNRTVKADSLNTGNGIIKVEVYHPDASQTGNIAEAVNYILKTENEQYHGLGNKVFLKIIDTPHVSERPVKPDVLFIFPVAILIALFLAGVYIYFFPEDKYDIKIIPPNGKGDKKDKEYKVKKQENKIKEQRKKMLEELSKKFPDRNTFRKKKQGSSGDASQESSVTSSVSPKKEEKTDRVQEKARKQMSEEKAKEKVLFGNGGQEEPQPEKENNKQAEEQKSPQRSPEEDPSDSSSRQDRKKAGQEDIEERGDMSNIFG